MWMMLKCIFSYNILHKQKVSRRRMKNTFHNCQNICKLADWVCLINIDTYLSTSSGILFLDIVIVTTCHKILANVSLGMCNDKNNKAKRFTNKRYFIPVKIENSTCDIASATVGTLFLCCVRVYTKIQERCCCLCFCYSTQRDMWKSRTLQHIHNMRREKRNKNGKIG